MRKGTNTNLHATNSAAGAMWTLVAKKVETRFTSEESEGDALVLRVGGDEPSCFYDS